MRADNWPDRPTTSPALWSVHRSASAILGTAIHDGHGMRPDTLALTALSDEQRLREEDPFTEYLIRDLPNRIVVHRSRFEVDLNRGRDQSVYLTPEQCWGLTAWRGQLPDDVVETSRGQHDDYYEMLATTLRQMEKRHGAFVVLDVHSYNHRRHGPEAPPTPQDEAPDINIGTYSMDEGRWGHVVDALMEHLARGLIDGRRLDVRKNVAFKGMGEQTRFIHHAFPQSGCAIAIEFKKIFMDEWTGQPNLNVLAQLRSLLADATPVIEKALETGKAAGEGR